MYKIILKKATYRALIVNTKQGKPKLLPNNLKQNQSTLSVEETEGLQNMLLYKNVYK